MYKPRTIAVSLHIPADYPAVVRGPQFEEFTIKYNLWQTFCTSYVHEKRCLQQTQCVAAVSVP